MNIFTQYKVLPKFWEIRPSKNFYIWVFFYSELDKLKRCTRNKKSKSQLVILTMQNSRFRPKTQTEK